MRQKECVAMILAGGRGERLGALTGSAAKPMVYFGDKHRIIDFTLSNCTHSGMDTLGVLTQYRPMELHDYIDGGQTWHLNKNDGGVFLLPSSKSGGRYTGTANAVYRNISFIERFHPEFVLILSGDHIYKMDYRKMLDFHKKTDADATIATVGVPMKDASRFGIMKTAENGLITEFAEKPRGPKSNLASMGIYIFKWRRLKKFLCADDDNARSQNDFGRNIIPMMLSAGEKLYAYKFDGYWRDVGTVQSLWESNMDMIQEPPGLDLCDKKWEVFTKTHRCIPRCISGQARIVRSIIGEGCNVCGVVENSVLSNCVGVGEGAQIVDSIVMPGVIIGKNVKINKAIIGANVSIGNNAEIGADRGLDVFFDNAICSRGISLVGPGVSVGESIKIDKNSHVDTSLLPQRYRAGVMSREMARWELVHG